MMPNTRIQPTLAQRRSGAVLLAQSVMVVCAAAALAEIVLKWIA